MSTQLSPQEWQMISAYLDGQLSVREKEHFEKRLNSRPELRTGLEEIQRTRVLLRSLPQRRAPRNFTLKPELAPQRAAPPRLFSSFRLASVLAGVLLVLAVAGELALGTGMLQPRRQTAQAPAPVAMEAQPQAAPEIIIWGTPSPYDAMAGKAYGMGGGGGGDGSVQPPIGGGAENPMAGGIGSATVGGSGGAAPQPAEVPQATPEYGIGAAGTEAPAEPIIAPTEAATADSAAATAAPAALAAKAPSAADTSGPILGVPPADQRGELIATQPAETAPTGGIAGLVGENLRVIQGALGVIAVAAGLAAFYLYRRANP